MVVLEPAGGDDFGDGVVGVWMLELGIVYFMFGKVI